MTMNIRNIPGMLIPLLLLLAGTLSAQTPDPGIVGPHAVLKGEYDLGDLAYTPPSSVFPYSLEVRGSVHYPADLTSGPFPVIVYLHGRHETCYDSVSLVTSSAWPCTGTRKPIISYAGYDYSARTLASHGYVVISISANAINAKDGAVGTSFQRGMPARGYLVQHHLDLWNTWNTTGTGPFDTVFNGKLDMQNIGTMGHSRGGEGVIYNAELNRSLGSPYGIKAVLTLAPVDFYRHVLNRTPLMNIAPYCDGDVSSLDGVHYYDDARYKDTGDEAPKHSLLVMGANHNFFNTVWTPGSYPAGGAEDWEYTGLPTDPFCGVDAAGNGRLDTNQQRAVYNTYAAAFYRYYLGHETAFAPILNVTDVKPPASALVDSSKLFMSYHPGATDRIDINRVDSIYNLTTNDLGGAVTTTSLTSPTICGGGLALALCNSGLSTVQRPHRGTSTLKGVAQMRLKWTDTTAIYQNDIPTASQDITGTDALIFRVCENFSDMAAAVPLSFSVQLVDATGAISNQVVTDYSNALFYPPGIEGGVLPKVLFNTVRIPVSAFTGIDLTHAHNIRFRFNGSATGAVLVSDIAFIGKACGRLTTAFTNTIVASYNATFTNTSATNAPDSLVWHWHFGDPASGTADTSTSATPTAHIFSGAGTYTVCLAATAYRKNGLVCTDTFCTTVTIIPPVVAVTSATQEHEITIVPNPAKDYLSITGAYNGTLTLVNLYGQNVFTTAITQQTISLPQTLAAGIYYAVVTTVRGRVFKKIVIVR